MENNWSKSLYVTEFRCIEQNGNSLDFYRIFQLVFAIFLMVSSFYLKSEISGRVLTHDACWGCLAYGQLVKFERLKGVRASLARETIWPEGFRD